MAAPAMSHIICSLALVTLIFVLPIVYGSVISNIEADMIERELGEIADYVSNTFENSYFLANSTENLNFNLKKELLYLPATVENHVYVLNITENSGSASRISAYLKNKPQIDSEAWLARGLLVGEGTSVESGQSAVFAGCHRNETGVYVRLSYGS